ncbi:RHS repeat domain-containing protein [Pseudomonas sp. DR48]|uniref:RHS repeat domain-containing protein n=1 Tax=Pseudomonas sp. DR48 TaxID=2871095 RepID=UPI0021BD3E82|nr:RHS repeat-associated core domain-containing protein [Pseudomonas sp. DR48]
MSTAHCNTPSVTSHDARGLPVRQIAYLRSEAGVLPLITRLRHDVIGRPVEQRDPRLAAALKPNLATVYGLTGQSVKVASVDAGVRTILVGPAGEIRQRWDGRGSHWRTTYDNQLRVLTLEQDDQPDVETFTYATALADPAHNLRGQLIKQVDPSGEFEIKSVSLHGQPLLDTRTITEAGKFTSSRTYSPRGAVLTHTDAGGHQQRMRYDSAGQLQQVQLRLDPTAQWTPVLEDARYNAAGQIIEQLAGNKMLSTWAYDDANGRLTALVAGVPGQDPLQHFKYQYDGVGNVLRIDDLTFKPVFFKNQLIDGHREFEYNSLYQMTSATGHDAAPSSDLPGRPLPSDPKNHLNYKQIYVYDNGGNLIRMTHEREVGGYTHHMFIDPNSNRGVRWKEGDPVPDFDTLFDPHGNLLASAPGRPLQWNSYDQLACATLVERDNGPNDEEVSHYSQGARVFKRHEWQASTLTHFHQVIFLPGLEIRTRDNGEKLHVITLPGGRGSVRCLHWVIEKPDGIEQNQLRYSVDDHLGSSAMELDQNARLISYEGYYPFGGTAWLTAVFLLEVSYKTCRYSGKEMDECGLYYYGSRYYAPWLWCWVSPDPAGAVDGLNLYAFVGNNPLRYVDGNGEEKAENVILNYSSFISTLEGHADHTFGQVANILHKSNVATSLARNLLSESMKAGIGFAGGYFAGENLAELLPQHQAVGSLNAQEVVPYSTGLTVGNFGGEAAGKTSSVAPVSGFNGPLIPQTSTMSIKAIDQELGLDTSSALSDWLGTGINVFFNNFVGSVVPGVGAFLAMGSRVQEAEDVKNGLDPVKIKKIQSMLDEWESVENERFTYALAAFKSLGVDTFNPAEMLPNINSTTPQHMLEPIQLSTLTRQHERTQDLIRRSKIGMEQYKSQSTTDNQFLRKQARTAKRHPAHV